MPKELRLPLALHPGERVEDRDQPGIVHTVAGKRWVGQGQIDIEWADGGHVIVGPRHPFMEAEQCPAHDDCDTPAACTAVAVAEAAAHGYPNAYTTGDVA